MLILKGMSGKRNQRYVVDNLCFGWVNGWLKYVFLLHIVCGGPDDRLLSF